MNRPSILLSLVVVAWIAGCSTPSRTEQIESRLAAAGFRVVPATTPEQRQMVQQFPPGELTLVTRDGKQFYVYPDLARMQLYIGQQEQYRAYQARVEIEAAAGAENRAAQQSVMEARNDSLPEWNEAWGSFTGD
ncbi:MAG: hypothetical protein KF791_17280 [Verrucomicrobiae bacterium]|nr:hypothetical protein [Verrucomicrobiae bacterium]